VAKEKYAAECRPRTHCPKELERGKDENPGNKIGGKRECHQSEPHPHVERLRTAALSNETDKDAA
jgi:hypothetical protein